FSYDLRLAFRSVQHGDNDTPGTRYQVHCAAHTRHHFAGYHPACEMALRVDLPTAEHGDVDMAATDQGERHRAVEGGCARKRADRPAAGIGQQGMRHALLGHRSGADQAILRLEEYIESRRHVVRDQGGYANAEIDQISRAEFERYSPRYDGLSIHGFTGWQ